MRLRPTGRVPSTFSVFVASVLFCGIAFSAWLSAAPQVHDWLHKVDDRTNHECAATLMSSGSVEHSACEPAQVKPASAPAVPAFRPQLFSRGFAVLEFSLLEHAPPSRS